MPVESLPQRPIFASEENEYIVPVRPPISRLAILALVLGLISVLVVINIEMITLPVLAITFGLIAYWQVSRDESIRGSSLALVGLGLGLAFATCAVTAQKLRDRYLFQAASQCAKHYLETLSGGKVLEAFELTHPEMERQVAGSSLEEHYKNVDGDTKAALESYRQSPKIVEINKRGPGGDWRLLRGESVVKTRNRDMTIVIRMIDATQSPVKEYSVSLERSLIQKSSAASSASWHVSLIK